MGKKRRLNARNPKFKAKHATHPRMQLLTATHTNVVAEEVIERPVEVEVTVAPVEVMVAAPPVIPQEEEAIVPPEIIAKSKRSRKRKTKTTKSTRKNTGA